MKAPFNLTKTDVFKDRNNNAVTVQFTRITTYGGILLAQGKYKQLGIFNTSSKYQIGDIIPNVIDAIVNFNQSLIIYSMQNFIKIYDISKDIYSTLLNVTDAEFLTLALDKDKKSILCHNNRTSQILSVDLQQNFTIKSVLKSNISFMTFVLDKYSDSIVTATGNCSLAKWIGNGTQKSYKLEKQLNYALFMPCNCRRIFIFNNQLMLIKKNLQRKVIRQHIINYDNFSPKQETNISIPNKQFNSIAEGFLINNYFMLYNIGTASLYGFIDQLSQIHQFNLTFDSGYFISTIFNSKMEQVYQAHKLNNFTTHLFVYKLLIRCPLNNSSEYVSQCRCNNPQQVYNKAKALCQRPKCEIFQNNSCKCPPNFKYNAFSLQCQIQCQNIPFAYLSLNKSKCNCLSPYTWIQQTKTCQTFINCQKIFAKTNKSYKQCFCIPGYSQADAAKLCSMQKKIVPPIHTPIQPQKDNSSPSIGLIIGIIITTIVLIIVGIVIYFKKCRTINDLIESQNGEKCAKQSDRPIILSNQVLSDIKSQKQTEIDKNTSIQQQQNNTIKK